jgi:glycolate oxidase iron-sulfur subunit
MSDKCILCGKCLEVCPLLGATGQEELGPRAKADLYALLKGDGSQLSSESAAKLAGLCLGCHRCIKVCSQGVDVPGLVSMLRGAHPDFKGWLWKTWLTHAKELWPTTSFAVRLLPEKFQPEKIGQSLKMLAGLKGGAGLDPFLTVKMSPETYQGEKVLLFAGCTANYVQKRWLFTAKKLLDGLGVEVLPEKFQCCGGGLNSAGFVDESEGMAQKNIDIWRKAGKVKIVIFCASCQSSLNGYDGYFKDPTEQNDWQKSLTPLSLLVQNTTFMLSANMPESIGYHRPCHVDEADCDFSFLQATLGDHLAVATQKECCGFGGVMRLGASAMADEVGKKCWAKLGKVEMVVTGCSACVAQLTASAAEGVEVGHWLEIIR